MTKTNWFHRVAMLGVMTAILATTLAGCGQGGDGMSSGPVATPTVDSFTTAVASIADAATDDTVPVDIEAIAVVLVENQPPVTVN